MKKYIPIVPTESENNLCLEVLYSKGGHNWFNGDNERRGYYLPQVRLHSVKDTSLC